MIDFKNTVDYVNDVLYNPQMKDLELTRVKFNPDVTEGNYVTFKCKDFTVRSNYLDWDQFQVTPTKGYVLTEEDQDRVKDIKDNQGFIWDMILNAWYHNHPEKTMGVDPFNE